LILPFLPSLGFTSDIAKVLVVLIIGSGSSIVSHANDSFFWVVTQMSNMDVKTGYKLQSGGTLVLGISAAIFIWIMSLIFI
jgi:GntP family gluconate:H+ symporter